MGSCASVHKEQDPPMGFRMNLVTKAKKLFIASPTKENKVLNGEKDSKTVDGFDFTAKKLEQDSGFGTQSPEFGSKDEFFFDSRAWLDSDCEDDFFSVNGEFTPSRSSTPNHPMFNPKINTLSLIENFPNNNSNSSNNININKSSEPSPRKKLADLFQETLITEKSINGTIATEQKEKSDKIEEISNKIEKSTPPDNSVANSVCTSSEMTPNREMKKKREKHLNFTGRCCLPGLVQTANFDDRRQSTV